MPLTVGWLAAANFSQWDVRHCELHQDVMRFQGGIPNLVGVVGAEAGLDLLEEIGREFIERQVRGVPDHAAFLQYRATFVSQNGCLSPKLREVIVELGDRHG